MLSGPLPSDTAMTVIAVVTTTVGPGWQPITRPRTVADRCDMAGTGPYPAIWSTTRVNVRGMARAAGTIIGRSGRRAPTQSMVRVTLR